MLIDDIFNSGIMDGHLDATDPDTYNVDFGYLTRVKGKDGSVFNIQDVWGYFWNTFAGTSHIWEAMKDKTYVIYPPTHFTWFECKMSVARFGILVGVFAYDDVVFSKPEEGEKWFPGAIPDAMLYLGVFYTEDHQPALPLPVSSFLFLDPDGYVIEGTNGIPYVMRALSDKYFDEWAPFVHVATLFALFTLSFLNVKNVVCREHQPDRRLQERRKKRGQLPLVKYYTLEIEAPGKRVRGDHKADGGKGEGASSRPLHLVRGHLADYREGSGLFGKYKGVYWMPAHFRGSMGNGVIKKRYRVKAGE